MPDTNKYPITEFVDKSSNFNKKKRCLKINEYLVLAYADLDKTVIKIYKLCNGLPLLDVLFSNAEDAIQVTEWITQQFGEYFPIWDQYPEADVFSMAKWSVPDGIRKYEAINLFKRNQKATSKDLEIAIHNADKHIYKWTYEHLR